MTKVISSGYEEEHIEDEQTSSTSLFEFNGQYLYVVYFIVMVIVVLLVLLVRYLVSKRKESNQSYSKK